APTWLAALVYLALGWVGVVALPELFSSVGLAVSVLVLVGGGLTPSVRSRTCSAGLILRLPSLANTRSSTFS
ncbi:MAG: hypothetical protein ACRDNA_08000, partial [Gaiellaceae bacterium]